MPVRTVFGGRPEGQMALQDRKLVAARLMRMLAHPRNNLHSGPLSQDDLDWVLKQFDGHIGRNWSRADPLNSGNQLDQFLDAIYENTLIALGALRDEASEILARAANYVRNTRCSDCGARTTACKGYAADILHFQDGPLNNGGQCLRLIRQLVDYFTERTEHYIDEYRGPLIPRPLPERIEIDIVAWCDGDRLLPLDGAIEFNSSRAGAGEGPDWAILTVRLPVGDARITGADFEHLDYALLSLAYALFHEIFVHGSQGRAGAPVPKVEPTCAFTEGAVDTAAFDLLFGEILADPAQLPKDVQSLSEAFRLQAKRFHNLRFDWVQASPSQAARLAPIDDMALRQRHFGRERIYQPLVDIEKSFQKPAGWARHCLIRLNLKLSVDQRIALSELADFWSPPNIGKRTGIQTALCGMVDSFLDTGDSDEFLNRLKMLAPY